MESTDKNKEKNRSMFDVLPKSVPLVIDAHFKTSLPVPLQILRFFLFVTEKKLSVFQLTIRFGKQEENEKDFKLCKLKSIKKFPKSKERNDCERTVTFSLSFALENFRFFFHR